MNKFLLIWFIVIYVIFTLIATKSWRYVMPLAPVIAIAAASFVSFLYDKMEHGWRSVRSSADTKWLAKFLAGCLIFFTATALVISTVDAYAGWRMILRIHSSFPKQSTMLKAD